MPQVSGQCGNALGHSNINIANKCQQNLEGHQGTGTFDCCRATGGCQELDLFLKLGNTLELEGQRHHRLLRKANWRIVKDWVLRQGDTAVLPASRQASTCATGKFAWKTEGRHGKTRSKRRNEDIFKDGVIMCLQTARHMDILKSTESLQNKTMQNCSGQVCKARASWAMCESGM